MNILPPSFPASSPGTVPLRKAVHSGPPTTQRPSAIKRVPVVASSTRDNFSRPSPCSLNGTDGIFLPFSTIHNALQLSLPSLLRPRKRAAGERAERVPLRRVFVEDDDVEADVLIMDSDNETIHVREVEAVERGDTREAVLMGAQMEGVGWPVASSIEEDRIDKANSKIKALNREMKRLCERIGAPYTTADRLKPYRKSREVTNCGLQPIESDVEVVDLISDDEPVKKRQRAQPLTADGGPVKKRPRGPPLDEKGVPIKRPRGRPRKIRPEEPKAPAQPTTSSIAFQQAPCPANGSTRSIGGGKFKPGTMPCPSHGYHFARCGMTNWGYKEPEINEM